MSGRARRRPGRRGGVTDGHVIGLGQEVVRLLDAHLAHGTDNVANVGDQDHGVVQELFHLLIEAPRRQGLVRLGYIGDDLGTGADRVGVEKAAGVRLLRQALDQVHQLHSRVKVLADAHLVEVSAHEAWLGQLGGVEARVPVGEPDAEFDQAIRLLDLGAGLGAAHAPLINAQALGMQLRQAALGADGHGVGQFDPLDQLQHRRA